MKKILLLLVLVLLCSCAKDYSCKAALGSEEKTFNCENCSKKDVEAYEKKLTDLGWEKVDCEK